MNPFLNPITGIPLLKNIIFDARRINRMSPDRIKKYKDKVFCKIVEYAYTVPLYHKKYKDYGVKPKDINGIKDITKLPFISKQDLVENFPENVLPANYNRKKTNVVSTGGSTGKPVSIYTDFSLFSGGIGASIRASKAWNINWKKARVANIGSFGQYRADEEAEKAFYSKIPFFSSPKNRFSINAFEPIKKIMEKLDVFRPDLIITYPVTFQNLAYLKNKGYGKFVKPKLLLSSGYMLDEYTRSYVQNAFNCRLLNTYGSAEAFSEIPVAFECPQNTWHINYDFFHIEAINDNEEIVDPNEIGHIVLTRLFGKCTPIIRYTGMDDWVKISPETKCSCGLCTPVFKDGVEGKISSSVILPDGRVYPAASFANLAIVLNELKTKKVIQFQIIQNKLNEIEVHLIIDEDLRDIGPPVELIFKKIKEMYYEKVGSNVSINVKEVKEIKSRPFKPAPLVISNLTEKEIRKAVN